MAQFNAVASPRIISKGSKGGGQGMCGRLIQMGELRTSWFCLTVKYEIIHRGVEYMGASEAAGGMECVHCVCLG